MIVHMIAFTSKFSPLAIYSRRMNMNRLPNRKPLTRPNPDVKNVNDLLSYIASHGDKIVYKYIEGNKVKEMSYIEFHDLACRVAAALTKMGLVGKRAAVIGDTSPHWLATYVGALAAGTVIVPMDKELALPEIEKFLTTVEAEAIVYSKGFNEKFVTTMETHPTLKHFIPVTPDESVVSDKILTFDALAQMGQEEIDNGFKVKQHENTEEMCEMLFTSGTTGTSKCVMLSQKNIFSAVSSAVSTVYFTKDDTIVSVLPVHHTYELMCLLAGMSLGMEIGINDSLRHVIQNFKRFQPTGLVLVPMFVNTIYKRIWSEAEKTGRANKLKMGLKLSKTLRAVGIDARKKIFKTVIDSFGGRLDHIVCGGAKLNPELITAFEDMGISIYEGFGITECSPLVAVTPYTKRKLGTIGPSVPCCEIRIDPNGEKTDEGYDIGEIQVNGDNVMLGYYNNPEANAAVFTEDGWFKTGDVGYLDSDKYVYITGRIKFVIVLENGKNVFPEEIEEYLDTIDTISECCVVGRKSEDGNEVVLTLVAYPNYSKFPSDVDDDTVYETIKKAVNTVNKKLPSYKQIKAIDIRKTEFEKTTTKKIKRQLVK